MGELEHAFFISTCQGIGRKTLQRLMDKFGSMENVYYAAREQLEKVQGLSASCVELLSDREQRQKAEEQWMRMAEKGVSYYSLFCGDYPQRLEEIFDPPKQLFVLGELPEKNRKSIAVVGARNCSYYGRDMARLFGYRLGAAGVNVISGMARGIDGWAHQGALESGGKTYAVLGCGVDVCYPEEHRKLYHSIIKRGGVLSEFSMGTKAKPNFFPLRNRIISGLSDGILVVEAREKSGSLITADTALEQGKDVFVVPGRIGDELSVGCNRLIRQGAVPVLSPQDILDYYGIAPPEENSMEEKKSELQQKILHTIKKTPVHIRELEAVTGASATVVMKEIMWLKQKKYIREVSRGYFVEN